MCISYALNLNYVGRDFYTNSPELYDQKEWNDFIHVSSLHQTQKLQK